MVVCADLNQKYRYLSRSFVSPCTTGPEAAQRWRSTIGMRLSRVQQPGQYDPFRFASEPKWRWCLSTAHRRRLCALRGHTCSSDTVRTHRRQGNKFRQHRAEFRRHSCHARRVRARSSTVFFLTSSSRTQYAWMVGSCSMYYLAGLECLPLAQSDPVRGQETYKFPTCDTYYGTMELRPLLPAAPKIRTPYPEAVKFAIPSVKPIFPRSLIPPLPHRLPAHQ